MQGAVVSQVDPRSAAEQAGLRVGDVVVAVDGRPIDDSGDLRNAVGLVPIGDTLNLTLLRSGKTESLEVKITQAVAGIAAEEKGLSLLAGSYLQDFRQGTGSGPVGGVLVAEVRQGSQAWRVGLRARDIILGVNRQRIDSVAGLRAAVEKAGRVVALTVQRDDNRLLIVIE
jgi:serine protease Do/serine protease DegQ